jgi:hypothetical protein
MTTTDIADIQVEQLTSEPTFHVDGNVKSKSRSNAHDLKSRRTSTMLPDYDVPIARKIRIAKYVSCRSV